MPTSTIASLTERGFRLFLVAGNRLSVEPASGLTDDDRATIRQHKDEIVLTLATPKTDLDVGQITAKRFVPDATDREAMRIMGMLTAKKRKPRPAR